MVTRRRGAATSGGPLHRSRSVGVAHGAHSEQSARAPPEAAGQSMCRFVPPPSRSVHLRTSPRLVTPELPVAVNTLSSLKMR